VAVHVVVIANGIRRRHRHVEGVVLVEDGVKFVEDVPGCVLLYDGTVVGLLARNIVMIYRVSVGLIPVLIVGLSPETSPLQTGQRCPDRIRNE
jgi:hypothetical protein